MRAVPVTLAGVSTGILRWNGDAEFLDCFGSERDACVREITKGTDIRVRRLQFLLETVLHCFVGANVPFLAGKQAGDRRFVVLIGLDAEIAPIVTIRYKGVIELLDRKRDTQILGVAVPDVVNETLKEAV